jgi:hypothetical protein
MTAFYWHGAMMAMAWLVLIPAGSLIARFYKVRRLQDYPAQLDDSFWWNTHRILQTAGAALAALAVWWAYDARGEVIDWQVPHVQLGVAALALCAAQLISPFLRGSKGGPTDTYADPADPLTWRGDHYDMTLQRRLFEAWHKNFGYVAMLIAVGAAWTGIETAGLAAWWKVGIVLAVVTFLVVFVRLTRQWRRVDTWLAIWGPTGR